jgi:phosphoenolpyruvate carboxylase
LAKLGWISGLDIKAEGSGITPELSRQINLIGQILGQVIRDQAGTAQYHRVEELRQLCKEASLQSDPAFLKKAFRKIQTLDLETLNILLRSFTTFFHLVNKAEQLEIIPINDEREIKATKESPRSESISEAIYQLKQKGIPLQQVADILSRLDIQPTFTLILRKLGVLVCCRNNMKSASG